MERQQTFSKSEFELIIWIGGMVKEDRSAVYLFELLKFVTDYLEILFKT